MKLKQKIEDDIEVLNFSHTQPTGDDYRQFVDVIHELLPSDIPKDTVYDSCLCVLGEVITDEVIATLAWRLAGNVRRLRNGLVVQPWAGTPDAEWVPVQITSAEFAVSRWGKRGADLQMKVLAGLPCTESFPQFWTTAYCHTFASRMGFSKWPTGAYPFSDIRELVNLRLYVEVKPGTAEISFEHIHIPSSCVTWNLKYIKRRARIGWPCPKRQPDALPCFRCPVGQDQCPVALHPITYLKGTCSQCNRTAWFEKESDEFCVDCHTRNVIRGK